MMNSENAPKEIVYSFIDLVNMVIGLMDENQQPSFPQELGRLSPRIIFLIPQNNLPQNHFSQNNLPNSSELGRPFPKIISTSFVFRNTLREPNENTLFL